MRTTTVLTLLTAIVASPSLACGTSPDLERIPGASDADHEARYNAYERDVNTIRAYESEKLRIENSWTVYLGKVQTVNVKPDNEHVRELRVKPVWQVRGRLPADPKVITEGPLSSCARRMRVLRGTKAGDLIIVFEAPGSINGMPAEDVRSGELIDAITFYALSLQKSP